MQNKDVDRGFLSDRQWKRLIRDIKEQRCILFLGPRIKGVRQGDKWYPLNEVFSHFLCNELDEASFEYEKDAVNDLSYIAQRFLGIPEVLRIDLEDEARDFYSSHIKDIPPIYEKLSALPFHLILNTTLDDYMERALNEKGKYCNTSYYNFKRKVKKIVDPEAVSPKTPLVYNLFGSYQHPESMVLTEDNQLEFVRNVVQGNPGIPEEILEQLDNNKSFLFIGFDLEHWQFRLVLESLNIKEGNATLAPKSENFSLRNVTKSFFQEHFRFNFIEQYTSEFVDELKQRLGNIIETSKPIVPEKAKNIFIVYNDRDSSICERLETTMRPLEKNKQIQIAHKGRIAPGQAVSHYIDNHIQDANVILLLLSADFLADDHIQEQELELVIKKFKDQSAMVIPIIGKACDWLSVEYLKDLNPVLNGIPLQGNQLQNQDESYFQIVEELKKRVF